MPELSPADARHLLRCVTLFAEQYRRSVTDVLGAELRGFEPEAIADLTAQLSLLRNLLDSGQPYLHETQAPLLKRILIDLRRAAAAEIEEPLRKAATSDAVRHVRREVAALERLMAMPSFAEVAPVRLPRLTDYLSIRHAEAALRLAPALAAREYDEKFHILEAPRLFLPDLAYYRARGALRDAAVAVAHVDIDDFKSFNTRYTESEVDAHLLPAFMECLEAHVFGRGHAYRFGGDEYVLTLPNASRDEAVASVRALQARLARQRYRRIEQAPTISAGVCVANVNCFLTDREVLAGANAAKNFAKATRKGHVATFDGALSRDEGLALA